MMRAVRMKKIWLRERRGTASKASPHPFHGSIEECMAVRLLNYHDVERLAGSKKTQRAGSIDIELGCKYGSTVAQVGKPELAGVAVKSKQQSGSKRMAEIQRQRIVQKGAAWQPASLAVQGRDKTASSGLWTLTETSGSLLFGLGGFHGGLFLDIFRAAKNSRVRG